MCNKREIFSLWKNVETALIEEREGLRKEIKMNKAEEATYKAYPYNGDYRGQGDSNSKIREVLIEGYHQAEKDLELTWEDMRELHIIFESLDVDIELSRSKLQKETLGYYQEILKRFLKKREKK